MKSTGASLAEFAVVTAMMATFVGTSAPKFSDLMEYGKEKSFNQIDRILTLATNFYNETARLEGRGRFPGQLISLICQLVDISIEANLILNYFCLKQAKQFTIVQVGF